MRETIVNCRSTIRVLDRYSGQPLGGSVRVTVAINAVNQR